MYIAHDGPDDNFKRVMGDLAHPYIEYYCTEQPTGYWGHVIRSELLKKDLDDGYVIITNHDNYAFPVLVAEVERCTEDFLYWDICHNYFGYEHLRTKLEFSHIDVCCVAVKTKIAKDIGWQYVHECSDWDYIQACWQRAKTYKKINKLMGVHN